jgi:hypothetical protein
MRYEVSERIRTRRSDQDLLAAIELQLKKISEHTERSGDTVVAKSIEASFGSINRDDTTVVRIDSAPDGRLLIGDVHYRPSAWFWVFTVACLFTYIGWLVPIVFYLVQKGTVRNALEECFRRIKNEFDEPQLAGSLSTPLASSPLDDLERLATLKAKGVVTDAEFEAKKKELLGL